MRNNENVNGVNCAEQLRFDELSLLSVVWFLCGEFDVRLHIKHLLLQTMGKLSLGNISESCKLLNVHVEMENVSGLFSLNQPHLSSTSGAVLEIFLASILTENFLGAEMCKYLSKRSLFVSIIYTTSSAAVNIEIWNVSIYTPYDDVEKFSPRRRWTSIYDLQRYLISLRHSHRDSQITSLHEALASIWAALTFGSAQFMHEVQGMHLD